MISRIFQGDALEVLRTLPDESVHCVVTSPPYWGLRDYGVAGQYGLEALVDCLGWATGQLCGACFICRLVAVFREVRRVLRADGTCWVNMGDSYAANHGSASQKPGAKQAQNRGSMTVEIRRNPSGMLKAKDMTGGPWRLALALQADGWILRSDIIWHKPTAMPESVSDRPSKAHEYLFLLAKSQSYFYDAEAIKEPVTGGAQTRGSGVNRKAQKVPGGWDTGAGAHGAFHREGRGAPQYRPRQNASFSAAVSGLVETRNKRTVWTIPAARFPGAHFATFPEDLPAICIKAGSPMGGIVLDPFFGAGTTGLVARRLGRQFVGIELSPQYCVMAARRIERDSGLFGPVEIVHAVSGDGEHVSEKEVVAS